jgi:hypothetical protein
MPETSCFINITSIISIIFILFNYLFMVASADRTDRDLAAPQFRSSILDIFKLKLYNFIIFHIFYSFK